LDTNNIAATRDDNGIYYYEEVANPIGSFVSSGAVLAIYYNLYNLNDELLASHQAVDGDSLLLRQGVSAVYPVGLDIGLAYMKEGETYSFIIPPELAYGQLESGALPANEAIRLQVQLIAITDENLIFTQELTEIDQYIIDNELNDLVLNPLDTVVFISSGVRYKRLTDGVEGTPINGNLVRVEYTAAYLSSGNQFDSSPEFEWIFGSDQPRELIPAFELGVSLMEINERALFLAPSSQAYRESACIVPKSISGELVALNIIPEYSQKVEPYTSVSFTITRLR